MNDELAGVVGLILLAVVAFLVYISATNAWPVCGLFALALVALLSLHRADWPLARAAEGVVAPSAWAFGILTAALLIFNLCISTNDQQDVVPATEVMLVQLSAWLPHWTKPTLWQLSQILIVLVAVNFSFIHFKLVRTFRSLKKLASKVTTTLTILASFSFAGSDPVLGKLVETPTAKLRARYVASQNRQMDCLRHYLLLRVKVEVVDTLTLEKRQYITKAIQTLSSLHGLSDEAERYVARTTMKPLKDVRSRGETIEAESIVTPSPPNELLRNPETVLAAQHQREDVAARLSAEAAQALEEALSASVAEGSKKSVHLALEMLGEMLDGSTVPFPAEVGPHLDKLTEEYAKRVFRPLIKRYAELLIRRVEWEFGGGRGSDAGDDAVRGVVQERLEYARTLAEKAASMLPLAKTSRESSARSSLTLRQRILESADPFAQLPPGMTEAVYVEAISLSRKANALVLDFGAAASQLGLVEIVVVARRSVQTSEDSVSVYRPMFRAIAERRRLAVKVKHVVHQATLWSRDQGGA